MCARRAASPVVSCCAICRKNGSGRGPCCSATRVGVSLELSRLSDELMTDARPESDPVIIKKYANRRLYNTDSSSYITLEHLAAMTRRSEEHTSELQSLMRISYAVLCLKKNKKRKQL